MKTLKLGMSKSDDDCVYAKAVHFRAAIPGEHSVCVVHLHTIKKDVIL